ncbi:hypothetical protein [Phascolarctobacterium sp.]|uniref:hypothetical protein n=1 Tax=Phascolarctobacterium sp. TaxID=2049039 RepID=UPI00386AEEDA
MKKFKKMWNHHWKFYGWPIVLLLALALLLWAVAAVGLPSYREYLQLRGRAQLTAQQAEKLQNFALFHSDYDNYVAEKSRELAGLSKKLPQCRDGTEAQTMVQQLALAQGVQLDSLQGDEAKEKTSPAGKQTVKDGLLVFTLRGEAQGGYYAVLRWLRQLENKQAHIRELKLQGTAEGMVKAQLVINVYGINKIM